MYLEICCWHENEMYSSNGDKPRPYVYNLIMPDRKLRVFLCHASQDKPVVRELYQRLLAEGWIDPWMDET